MFPLGLLSLAERAGLPDPQPMQRLLRKAASAFSTPCGLAAKQSRKREIPPIPLINKRPGRELVNVQRRIS
jgi:hypothetical protein